MVDSSALNKDDINLTMSIAEHDVSKQAVAMILFDDNPTNIVTDYTAVSTPTMMSLGLCGHYPQLHNNQSQGRSKFVTQQTGVHWVSTAKQYLKQDNANTCIQEVNSLLNSALIFVLISIRSWNSEHGW